MKTILILLVLCTISMGTYARGGGGGGHRSSGSHSSGASHHSSSGHVNSQNHSVSGYTKKDGTHVAPSHATNPNSTRRDNYTHKGNTNPYTSKEGAKK
jgi:hypothetical protein